MSYRALDSLSSSAAGLIAAHGIRPGDRVGLLLPDVPPLAELYYGILRHGAIAVPMNPLLIGRQREAPDDPDASHANA